jgi:hypothetical protein
MGNPIHYAGCGKEMLGLIYEKMATLELATKGGRFFASSLIAVGNYALACNGMCTVG